MPQHQFWNHNSRSSKSTQGGLMNKIMKYWSQDPGGKVVVTLTRVAPS